MNIGIVTTWFERGAAYVSKQYRTLLSEYNQVYIFARGGERYAIGDQEWDDETVYWAERKEKCPTYFEMDEFISWIKENKIELKDLLTSVYYMNMNKYKYMKQELL